MTSFLSASSGQGIGAPPPPSSQTLALRGIDSSKQTFTTSNDFVKNIGWLNNSVDQLSSFSLKLQEGVEDANENFIEQIQGVFADIFVLFLGLNPQSGIDIGDVKYVFQAMGALLGVNSGTPFPLNLYDAVIHMFSTYLAPSAIFGDFLFGAIFAVLEQLGMSPTAIAALQNLLNTISGTGVSIGDMINSLARLVISYGTGLDQLLQAVDDFINLTGFGTINLNSLRDIFRSLTDLGIPFIDGLTGMLNRAGSFLSPLSFLSGSQIITLSDNFIPPIFDKTTVWSIGGDANNAWVFDNLTESLMTNGNSRLKTVSTQEVFPVKPGQTLVFNGKIKWSAIPLVTTAFGMVIRWMQFNVEYSRTNINIAGNHTANSVDWVPVSATLTVPANVDGMKVGAYVGLSMSSGIFWAKDFTGQVQGVIHRSAIDGLSDAIAQIELVIKGFANGLLDTLGISRFFDMFGGIDFLDPGWSASASWNQLHQQTLTLLSSIPILGDVVDAIAHAFGYIGAGFTPANIQAYIGDLSDQAEESLTYWAAMFTKVGGSVITDLTHYLDHIPAQAVMDTVFGTFTNLGSGVQGFANDLIKGISSFFNPGTNYSTSQVVDAGAEVRSKANSANNIGIILGQKFADRSLQRPSYLGIDPSADAVFNLSDITGSVSPSSTVPVTQSASLIGVMGMPDSGNKQSLCWLGSGTTNITSMWVNLYSINSITGEFTKLYTSVDLMGTITPPSNSLAWYYHNLPVLNYIATKPGEWYAAEIQVKGSGTYNVVGKQTGWTPLHPNVFPRGLGCTRNITAAPVYNTGIGTVGKGGNSVTSTITVPADTDCIVVPVSISIGGGGGSITCDINGTNIPVADSYTFSSGNAIAFCVLTNMPPALVGSARVVTVACSGYYIAARAFAYKNVSTVGTAAKTSGTGTSISQSISGTNNQLVVQVAGNVSNTAAFTGYSKTSRWAEAGTAAVNINTFMGEFVGSTGSQTGSMTSASSVNWGSMMLPLNGIVPVAPSTIASPIYSSNVPWFALCGAEGVSEHPPEVTKFDTVATHTYNIPAWIIDGDLIDVMAVSSGGGGHYAGDGFSGANALVAKGGKAGNWYTYDSGVTFGRTLQYGTDIPLGTTSFTVQIGAPGTGGAIAGTPTDANLTATDASNLVITISGFPTITVVGGLGGVNTGGWPVHMAGQAAGDKTFNGITYYGGAQVTPSGPGLGPVGSSAPASGGSVGGAYADGAGSPKAGSSGAIGSAWITARQQ